jgi:hypothetical protein
MSLGVNFNFLEKSFPDLEEGTATWRPRRKEIRAFLLRKTECMGFNDGFHSVVIIRPYY